MNTQVRQFSDSRWFQIGMLAALAVALMIGAAYFFGTGLRADTAKSVAASPIGSSLTAIRESRLDDYYGRFSNSSAAASSASLAKSRSDFYADLNNSSLAARAASLAALPESSSDFSIYLRGAPAVASSASLTAAQYAAKFGVPAASLGRLGNTAAAAAPAMTLGASHYARLGSLTAAEAASLGNIAPAAVPAKTLAASHYARLGSLTAAEATSLGNIAPAATADPYQNEWMGFTSPESVGARLSVAPDPATDPSTSIKPEGINPSGAVDSASKQYPWIKPEGIK